MSVVVGVNESRDFVVLAATVHDLILVAAVYMVLRNSSLGRKSASFKIVGRGLLEVSRKFTCTRKCGSLLSVKIPDESSKHS